MAKNLAILVGVTDYLDSESVLPACANDVDVMKELLNGAVGKFDEIFVTPPGEDGQHTKSRIADYIARHSNDDIDELFFYFTGHGDFVEDEFRFLLRDYSKAKPAQTSLTNTELDNLLRALGPKVVVKVIDACYSGMPYIKDGNGFSEYMKSSTQNVFETCYFLCSSQSDQRSWAASDLSYFTRSFVEAVASSSLASIRYKDVIDYISDAFQRDSKQKPLFVTQGSFTEVFGEFSAEVRERLALRVSKKDGDETSIVVTERRSFVDVVSMLAKDYVTVDQAIQHVSNFKSNIEKNNILGELLPLFEVVKEFREDYAVPKAAVLGEWAKKDDRGFFVVPTYNREAYEAPAENPFGSIARLVNNGAPERTVTKYRNVIDGLVTQIKGMPFNSVFVELIPKLPNLRKYAAWVTCFLSKKEIQISFCFSEYKEVAWNEYKSAAQTEWTSYSTKFSEFDGGARFLEVLSEKLHIWMKDRIATSLNIADDLTSGGEPTDASPASNNT
ncbi:caspase family protein [Burkholderia sp. B21-005]|uniref:caspase family protein n=1 Tax=Burkholderia sp. B21-005 TaxID=2890406 RepID=UPI001E5B863C|nr:caspase family protein [Burkholderia sp. B21-005]UEP40330.1 caspase family protein [Burkholderia sp. B21-005]